MPFSTHCLEEIVFVIQLLLLINLPGPYWKYYFSFWLSKKKLKAKTRTAYLKKEPHFLVDQLRTCRIFMLCYRKPIFFSHPDNQFSLYRVSLGGCKDICPKENCPPVRVRVKVGGFGLRGNCPRTVWKALVFRNRNIVCLSSRSYSEINSICSNKWTLYQLRH